VRKKGFGEKTNNDAVFFNFILFILRLFLPKNQVKLSGNTTPNKRIKLYRYVTDCHLFSQTNIPWKSMKDSSRFVREYASVHQITTVY